MERQSYLPGKVGEDIVLQYELTDVDIVSANIAIRNRAADTVSNTVDTSATLPSARIAQYIWTPDSPGLYYVEWHIVHSTNVDLYTPSIPITITNRIAA